MSGLAISPASGSSRHPASVLTSETPPPVPVVPAVPPPPVDVLVDAPPLPPLLVVVDVEPPPPPVEPLSTCTVHAPIPASTAATERKPSLDVIRNPLRASLECGRSHRWT